MAFMPAAGAAGANGWAPVFGLVGVIVGPAAGQVPHAENMTIQFSQ